MQERLILHIDMNSFFASCEQVVHPELKGQPIIVVGDPDRRSGIVLAASYEAKAYGIKTTMPIYQAKQCLPTVIAVRSTYGLYASMSQQVMDIFDQYTPLKEQLSIDEAFLDMTGSEHLFGKPEEIALKIQQHISTELDLGCSVGISTNKLLAKMASDMKKPMGITTLYPYEIQEKMWPMPVGKLYGIGKKTEVKLHQLGIKTIGELAQATLVMLQDNFGERHAVSMQGSANGRASAILDPDNTSNVQSVGNELTYSHDLTEEEEVKQELLVLADTVGYRLRKKMLKGRTIQLKIKYNDFKVITRSMSIDQVTDITNQIFGVAFDLYLKNKSKKPIRLLGISVSNFKAEEDRQLSLFESVEQTSDKVDQMVDRVRNQFGYDKIYRGSILNRKHGKIK